MLLNRPALAVFRACYDFIRRHYYRPRRVWDSVFDEIRTAVGLIPLLSVDWSLGWSSCVGCSDVSLHGYAVRESEWAPETVAAVG
eukprot:267511-Heterocapsa_arctica.AAC.1